MSFLTDSGGKDKMIRKRIPQPELQDIFCTAKITRVPFSLKSSYYLYQLLKQMINLMELLRDFSTFDFNQHNLRKDGLVKKFTEETNERSSGHHFNEVLTRSFSKRELEERLL